jgi:hypothetical protein
MKTGITIVSAKYVDGYKIKIKFSDGKVNTFDYTNLVMRDHEESKPYRDIEKFKKFKIVHKDSIAWGNDWDMLLSFDYIYNKTFFSEAGRKRSTDKKQLIRLYVPQSIINKFQNIEKAQSVCYNALGYTI